MKTERKIELLKAVKKIVTEEPEFTCITINRLDWKFKLATEYEVDILLDWFLEQKPTPTKHPIFFKHHSFLDHHEWWDDINDVSNTQRIKFLSVLIKELEEL